MTMPQAIRSAFVRWCTFSGRAGGTEYWLFVLFGTIVFGLASLLDHAAFGRHALFWATCTLVFLIPYIAIAVRRLHDTNRSGWWLLLVFVPLGNVVLLIWFCVPSTSGPNRFGPMSDAIGMKALPPDDALRANDHVLRTGGVACNWRSHWYHVRFHRLIPALIGYVRRPS